MVATRARRIDVSGVHPDCIPGIISEYKDRLCVDGFYLILQGAGKDTVWKAVDRFFPLLIHWGSGIDVVPLRGNAVRWGGA